MKLTAPVLLSAVLLGVAAQANAQAPTPPRNPFGNGNLPEVLKDFDVDGDGKLSVEERQAFIKAMREKQADRPKPTNPWDTDGDGKLSPEEIKAAQEAIRAKIEAERKKRFEEMDKDDDGFLSPEEFVRVPNLRPEVAERIIAHLDKDSDGKISLEEFLAALRPPVVRPPGGGGGTPPPPPPPPPSGDGR